MFSSIFSFARLASDTISKATFTEKLNRIMETPLEKLLQAAAEGIIIVTLKIIAALAIFLIGRWAIRYLRKLMDRMLLRRAVESSLRTFLISLVGAILVILLVFMIIEVLGINTTSFLALFASAGLAFGIALSGTLQNFAGGVMILIFKPYRVGDFIEAQGQTGTVREILIFNTILNTPDNKRIILPNGAVSTGIINNYSREKIRRVDWTLSIAYGDSYDVAKATIAAMLDRETRVLKDPASFIALHSLGDSAVRITVWAWVKSPDYWNVYFDINEQVYKQFAAKGLSIPYPQMEVHLHPKESSQSRS